MSGTLNKVILIGNLGRDPEMRGTKGGGGFVTLSLATSESWQDKHSGDHRERIEWHHIVIFNPALAEIAFKYLRKGSRVYVEGSLQTRKWTDQGGQERYTTETVLGQYNGRLLLLGEPAQQENFGLLPDDDINLQSSEAEAEEETVGGDSRPIDGTIRVSKITMATIGAAPERCKIAGMPVDCAIWAGQATSIEIHEDPEKRVSQRTGEPLMFEALKGLFGAIVLDEGLPERVYKSDTLYFPINHHLAVAAVKRSGVFNFSFLFTARPSGSIAGYSWSAKNLSKYDRRMEGQGRPGRAARSDGRRRRG